MQANARVRDLEYKLQVRESSPGALNYLSSSTVHNTL